MNARPWIDPAMLERILPTRELTDRLGELAGIRQIRAEPVHQIIAKVAGLNPALWPRCLHCGGDVNCDNYDPDTKGEWA